MRRPLALRLFLVFFTSLLALPAHSSMSSFAYRWKEGAVTVRWHEGSWESGDATRRGIVAHWKRLAVSGWPSSAGPLSVDVTFRGRAAARPLELLGGTPHIRLTAGGRTVSLQGSLASGPTALTDQRLLASLYDLLRSVDPPEARNRRPEASLADDGWPRLSPDGKWVAFRSWRNGRLGVWVAAVDGTRAWHAVPPHAALRGRDIVRAPVIKAGPTWSQDGRRVFWIQGGLLCEIDARRWTGRILTDPESFAVGILPSPRSAYALLTLSDDQLLLLDLKGSRSVPIHALVPRLTALSDLDWSPSGRRVLFQGRGGASPANAPVSSPGIDWLDRLARAARGQPSARRKGLAEEDYAEHAVVLDLVDGRLITISLDDRSEAFDEITGTAWSPDEKRIVLSTRGSDGASGLWGVDLQIPSILPMPHGRQTRPAGQLLAIGWRQHGSTLRALLVEDERLLTVAASDAAPVEAGTVEWLRVSPGPDGGYLGDDAGEVETEDEPETWLAWEIRSGSSARAWRRRLSQATVVQQAGDNPILTCLRDVLKRENVVDIDLDERVSTAVLCISAGGGIGELVTLSPGGAERLLSRALASATVSPIPMRRERLARLGARSGLAALTSDPDDERRLGMVWAAGFLVLAGTIAFIARRRRLAS